jgi:hypothetical protein
MSIFWDAVSITTIIVCIWIISTATRMELRRIRRKRDRLLQSPYDQETEGPLKDVKRSTGDPHDRLTRICATLTETLDEHPEALGTEKCIIFLNDEEKGGLVMHGYGDDLDAIADLMIHLKAIFEANGKQLGIMPIDETG